MPLVVQALHLRQRFIAKNEKTSACFSILPKLSFRAGTLPPLIWFTNSRPDLPSSAGFIFVLGTLRKFKKHVKSTATACIRLSVSDVSTVSGLLVTFLACFNIADTSAAFTSRYAQHVGNQKGLDMIAKSMTANANGLCPSLYIARYVAHDDGLAEYGSPYNITDGAVG